MSERRIESRTSRTAEITCLTRAASSLETSSPLRSDDHLAVALLPSVFALLVRTPLFRQFYRRVFAPAGVYEYVIARTKYIDEVFRHAMAEHFDQVLIFGAGFDTRALRFRAEAARACVFELDAPHTQQAKIGQYQKRKLDVPSNVVFVAIDFDKDSLPQKLDTSGFHKGSRSLFILEGLLMYLDPGSVRATLQAVGEYAGAASWVVFDYVRASVFRDAVSQYREAALLKTVSRAGEQWRFGIEPSDVAPLLATYGFDVADHRDAESLEDMYFRDPSGRLVARVDGTHCIVLAVRR